MTEPSVFEIVTKGLGNGTWTVSFRVGEGEEYEFRLSGFYGEDEYPPLVDQLSKALLAILAAGRAEVQELSKIEDYAQMEMAVENDRLKKTLAALKKRIDEAPLVGTGDTIIMPGRFRLVPVEEPR